MQKLINMADPESILNYKICSELEQFANLSIRVERIKHLHNYWKICETDTSQSLIFVSQCEVGNSQLLGQLTNIRVWYVLNDCEKLRGMNTCYIRDIHSIVANMINSAMHTTTTSPNIYEDEYNWICSQCS